MTATQVQLRRGSTADHTTFTGAEGEMTVDTDQWLLIVHDGTTPGGFAAATSVYVDAEILEAAKATDWGRKGADIASATNTDLGAATGDLVDVTGTTTITAITLAEGRQRVVRFTGTLTLTNGASLVLPGGADIVTAAGDFAIFRGYAAGVVRCVGYFAATGLERERAYVDLASAATTAIGGVASRHVRITGTTGITSFGTAAAGTWRRVRFAAALTLTYNGTSMILPGAGSITVAAGDTLTAVSLGSGNWVVTDYQPASGFVPASGGTFTGDITISNTSPDLNFIDTDTGADSRISGSSAVGGMVIEADYNNEVANSTIIFKIDGVTVATMTAAMMTWAGVSGITISSATPVLRLIDTDTNANATISVDQATGSLFIAADPGAVAVSTLMLTYIDGVEKTRLTQGGGMQIGAPTGGDKGLAALNVAGAIYENNVEVAKLSGAAFTGAVSISGAQTPLTLTYSDNGAGSGPLINMVRESTSPAANDVLAYLQIQGRDSAANLDVYGALAWSISDPTSTSEDALLSVQTVVAGSFATRLLVGGGLFHGSATGGDKGNNTINFGAVYDDNTLLTCMAMAEKFLETGEFTDADVAEWDARVPDQIEPARTEQMPVMEKVPSRQIVRDDDGSLRVAIVEADRQCTEPVPVYDVDGKTGIEMVEEPVFEVVEVPERVIPRTHAAARVFKAMIDEGFDPRDPAAYIRKMRADEALPGMPTKHDWQHNALSSGEMMSRLWLATELLALAFATLTERVTALEEA